MYNQTNELSGSLGGYRFFLPFPLQEMIDSWSALQSIMVKNIPSEFARDEWAYIIRFIDSRELHAIITQAFGVDEGNEGVQRKWSMVRPRGTVALWLPNNVSLLGPLMMIMVSLTGNKLWVKKGSHSSDLAGAFYNYILEHAKDTVVGHYFSRSVSLDYFPRDDERHKKIAEEAAVRIVFGSDQAAMDIHQMAHPPESVGLSFINKRSEVWIQKGETDDAALADLLKVFAIYGKAGCTSPSRLLLIDQTYEEAIAVRDRLVHMWSKIMGEETEIHRASESVMASQWAVVNGWKPTITKGHGAVFAVGKPGLKLFEGFMALPIIPVTLEQAVDELPDNIQTIGVRFRDETMDTLLASLADTRVKRIVSISQMHHFGSPWDGFAFWRQLFEEVEVSL